MVTIVVTIYNTSFDTCMCMHVSVLMIMLRHAYTWKSYTYIRTHLHDHIYAPYMRIGGGAVAIVGADQFTMRTTVFEHNSVSCGKGSASENVFGGALFVAYTQTVRNR